MKANFSVIVFLSVVWFVFLVVQSSASTVHDHGMISPFDSSKHRHKLHCDLNRHDLSSIYCPQHIADKKKENAVIALDCNGKTSATLPVFAMHTGNENLFHAAYFNSDLVLTSQRFAFLSSVARFLLPKQIDHPPRNV